MAKINVEIDEELFSYKGVDGEIVSAPHMENPFGEVKSFLCPKIMKSKQ